MPASVHIAPLAPPSSSSVATGLTLQRLRRRLADELGSWAEVGVTALATQGEASRVVLAGELREDEAGYQIPGNDGRYGAWVYARTGNQAGVQRRILRDPEAGYLGNVGAVLLSRPYTSPIAVDSLIEVTSPLPVKRHLGIKGLNDLANEGLALIWVRARLTFTGNGTYSYDLSGYPWADRGEAQLWNVLDTQWLDTSRPAEVSLYPFRLVTDGTSRTLVTENLYSASDTFYVDGIVKADRLLYDGASWSYVTTPGLQGDDWATAAPEDWALAFAMPKALGYLIRLTDDDERLDEKVRTRRVARLERRLQEWAWVAGNIQLRSFPKAPAEPERVLASVSSPRTWR